MGRGVLAFALGIVLVQQGADIPPGSWLICLGIGACAGLWALHPRGRTWGLVVLCVALGGAWAAWRAELRLQDALAPDWEGRDVQVTGVVASLPQVMPQGIRFELEVEQVTPPEAQLPGRLLLSWYAARSGERLQTLPRAGDRWDFVVRLKRPHGNANPHEFDYEAWLFERGLRATGYVRSAPAGGPIGQSKDWRSTIERLRGVLRERIFAVLPPEQAPYAGILVALVMGDQRAIPAPLWTVFNRTGVTHLLSVSGLHVTMVAGLFGLACGFAWRRSGLVRHWPAQKVAVASGWAAAGLYAFLAGFAVPAQRTFYMLSVASLALLSGRAVAPSRTLAAALAVVLILDPWAVLAPGFWLSFGAVGALFYAFQGRVGAEKDHWQRRLAHWGWSQWVAMVASLPVLLMVFQQMSLVSPLSNALAIPLVSLVVTPLALLGTVLPWPPLWWSLHGLVALLMDFLEVCARWPVWYVAAPAPWAVGLAAMGVGLLLLPRGIPGRGFGMLMVLPVVFWTLPGPAAGDFRATVLDVGQGLAVVVETQTGAGLYDTGPAYSAESDAGARVVVPFLRARGIHGLDWMMVTHRDTDHAGGAASVLGHVTVKEIHSSVAGWSGRRCEAGQAWTQDGVRFQVLHPPVAAYERDSKPNALSCVLRIEGHAGSLLLTSDIEAAEEAALLHGPWPLKSDVLLVPHHGSKTSSTPAFLTAVGGTDAVVPVGYRNRFGHPRADVLRRYEERGYRIWRTDTEGAVSISFEEGAYRLQGWRQTFHRYWHGR